MLEDDLNILTEKETIYFDDPSKNREVQLPWLSDEKGVVTPDARSMLKQKHPKFENDERYKKIIREAQKLALHGIELVYYPNFDYSKGLQLEPDERTKKAQCRQYALNKQKVDGLTNTFNNGTPVHKPPVAVAHPEWDKAYTGAGNHRAHGKANSNNPFGPLLLLVPKEGCVITSQMMEAVLGSIARKSNAETDDDVSTDTDGDIHYQISVFFNSLPQFTPKDLEHPLLALEKNCIEMLDTAKSSKKPAEETERARKNIIKMLLERDKDFYLNSKDERSQKTEVTKIYNRVFSKEEFQQKYDWPSSEKARGELEKEIFSEHGVAFEADDKTYIHTYSSTASFKQLFSSMYSTVFGKYKKGEIEWPEKFRIIVRADKNTDKVTTVGDTMRNILSWLNKYNNGESSLGIGNHIGNDDNGDPIILKNPDVEAVLFPRYFNCSSNSNRVLTLSITGKLKDE